MNWWDAPITQGFTWGWTPPVPPWADNGFHGHSAYDLGVPYGTPISTPANGTILGAGCHPWGGQVDILSTLEDGRPYVFSFLHLSLVAAGIADHIGQSITAGTVIGFSGGLQQGACPTQPRFSSGAHLHFEITYGRVAPYDDAGGQYYPANLPFSPTGANTNRHPQEPHAILQAIRDGSGILSSSANPGGPGSADGPTPGQQAHSILDSVPGFAGICQALDAIEQFEPFNPPNSTVGIGPFQASNPLDNFGYAVAWTARNAMVIAVRLLITGVGLGLLWLLFLGLLAANRWVQEAGGLAAAAAIGAV